MILTNDKKIALIILILVLLFVIGFAIKVIYDKKYAISETTKSIFSDGQEDSVFYTDIKGNKISLEQYLGKVLIVTSWASWTPFSTTELASVSELSTLYSQDKVVFLAINRKETREQAERFVNTIPTLNSSLILVLDTRDHFYTSIGGYAMPETVLYDKKGNIIEHIHGTLNKDKLKEKIDSLLK